MVSAPPVLAATRTRLLASNTVVSLVGQGSIGSSGGVADIGISTDPKSGLPWQLPANACAVTLSLRDREWMSAANSARFPVVAIAVWASGNEFLDDGELLARQVAMSLAMELDDPANSKAKQWTDGTYVNTCRWSGFCGVVPVDNSPGLWRAEVQIEMQVV